MATSSYSVVRYTDGVFEFLTEAGGWSANPVEGWAIPTAKEAASKVRYWADRGVLCDGYLDFGEITERVTTVSPLK